MFEHFIDVVSLFLFLLDAFCDLSSFGQVLFDPLKEYLSIYPVIQWSEFTFHCHTKAQLEFFYTQMPAAVKMLPGQGLIVALAYRIITVLIAAVGICYYLGSRQEVAEVIEEAEHPKEAEGPPAPEAAASLARADEAGELAVEAPPPAG